MISFRNVSKSYPSSEGRRPVLTGVTHDFPRGKHTALLGKNGAGKSTMMRLLSGSERPDYGQVERHATVSWPLGFKGGLHGSLTGRENVSFISRIYGQDHLEMMDFVEDFAGLGKYIDEETKTYSSGMKARLSFGISMAVKFDYYLIDEVIAVGDTAFKRKCKKFLSERLESATVILVSHSSSLMKDFCEHGVVLEDGTLKDFPTLDDAIAYYER
jgi:capsular polysaccharide transport system ATP-binding protein